MTQAALAKTINEKPAVVNQYENGKAIPNGQVRLFPSLGWSNSQLFDLWRQQNPNNVIQKTKFLTLWVGVI